MIDTLRLTGVGIDQDQLINIEDWEVTYKYDNLKQAKKIILLNQDHEAKYHNGTIGLTFYPGYFNIQISSVPAMIYGTSQKNLSFNDLSKIEEWILNEVNAYIDLQSFNGFTVTRVDNSSVFIMSELTSKYIEFLDGITPAQQGHYYKKHFNSETIEFFNDTRKIGFYDTVAKNKRNKIEMSFINQENISNLLRYEIQNKNTRAIKDYFKQVLKIDELNKEWFITMMLKQRKEYFSKYFNFSLSSEIQSFVCNQKALQYMRSKYKRNTIYKWLAYLTLKNGLSLREIEQIMKIENYSVQYIHRTLNDLKSIQMDVAKAKLYEELKQKIDNDIIQLVA